MSMILLLWCVFSATACRHMGRSLPETGHAGDRAEVGSRSEEYMQRLKERYEGTDPSYRYHQ